MATDPLLLVTALTKALAHRIRTPLTVVTNELSFFASQGHDCARALQRSKDIAEVLKLACSLGSGSQTKTSIDLEQTIRAVFPSAISEPSPSSEKHSFLISADSIHLTSTLRLIQRLVRDLGAQDTGEHGGDQGITINLSVQDTAMNLTARCVLHDPISVAGTYHSLTELFSSALHLDLIEPALIDAGANSCGMLLEAQLVEGKFQLRCIWNKVD